MRAGACATQQTLSAEAASVLKHSLSLARRRGHAQVTPLHVAATLLTSRASLLRRACLNSHPHQPSHPLQCRALELCFNVALNRLPATPGPLLHAQPSLSNALVAALKRAQAHQRRGCIEQQQQQQPLIAIKVELEQLVLSILDDPSVSRVMREAGFSSTAVKSNLEDSNYSVSSVFQCYSASGGIYSTPSSPPTTEGVNPSSFWHNPFLFSPQKRAVTDAASLKEDVKVVLEVLLRKKRSNTVIVGDSLSLVEGLVAELMGKVERGDVPEELKSAHFIKFQFSTVPLGFMKREEVEMNIADLKRKVDSFVSTGGVIVYTGDLKWTVDTHQDDHEGGGGGGGGGFCGGKEAIVYSPVDHLIAEMGKLLSWYNSSNARVWLMATANYQTYMKCQMKQPPLDVQWALQAVPVPSGGLGLSLNATSDHQNSRFNFSQIPLQDLDKKPYCVKDEQDVVLNCCPECTSNYEKEAAGFKSIQHKSFPLHTVIDKDTENGSAQLPFWLKSHAIDHTLGKKDLAQLKRKYNYLCRRLHQGNHNSNNSSSVISNQCYLGRNYSFTSSYAGWPNKNSISPDAETISFVCPAVQTNQTASILPKFRRQQSCHIEFSFSNGSSKCRSVEPNLDSLKGIDEKELKITLALGSSTYADAPANVKNACNANLLDVLQENVPWQSEVIPLIVEVLTDSKTVDQNKFVLIQGNDVVGKRRLAVGIAKTMFGSSDLLFTMNMRKNSNTMAQNREMLDKALRDHEKLVILVEDVECADPEFVKFLVDGYKTGKLETSTKRDERGAGQTIFFLTMDGADTSQNKAKESMDSVIQMTLLVNESTRGSRMLNLDNKRKADWDLSIRSKSPRNTDAEEVSSGAADNKKKEFTRQTSSNALDLNIKADEEEVKEDKPGEVSTISSDLTRDITIEQHNNALKFLEKIKTRFALNTDSDEEERARDMFLSKFKRSFQELTGSENIISSFDVEEVVLEKILQGSSLYLNSLFEQWLKEVFQTSLQMIDTGEREKVSIRLCLGESCQEDGFRGTCLPKRIQVSFTG